MSKRFLCALLTLCMVLALLPSAALAVTTPEEELINAIANVAENGTITLGKNISLTGKLTITGDKSFTIDLNGCTLSYSATAIEYKGTGTLTITDSSTTGGGTITTDSISIVSNGNGKILVNGKAAVTSNTTTFVISGGAEGMDVLEIAGGTVSSDSTVTYAIDNSGNGKVTVSGGTVTGASGGINSTGTGGVAVSGGTAKGTSYHAILSSGNVTLTGGTVESTGSNEAIYCNHSQLIIPSGTVVVKGSKATNIAPVLTDYTSYQWRTASDGTFTPSTTAAYVWAASDAYVEIKPLVTYTLTYTAAGANGTITGVSPQTVNSGESGTAVTAVPNAGYHFVSWSDGITTATRTDANVMDHITVTANFEKNASGGGHTSPTSTTVYNDPSKANANIWLSGKGLRSNDLLLTQTLTSGSDYNALLMVADQSDILGVYDISLQSGKSSTGSGMYLTFDLDSGYAGQTITLVHKKADGTFEYFNATAGADGNVKFGPLYELSPFMLVNGQMLYTPDYALTDIPKTGDSSNPLAFILISLAVMFGMGAATYKKRRI